MNRHRNQFQSLPFTLNLFTFLGLYHAALFVHLCLGLFQPAQNIPILILGRKIQYPAEQGAFAVQMRGWHKGDKKLTAVHRGARGVLHTGRRAVLDGSRGHRQHAAGVMS